MVGRRRGRGKQSSRQASSNPLEGTTRQLDRWAVQGWVGSTDLAPVVGALPKSAVLPAELSGLRHLGASRVRAWAVRAVLLAEATVERVRPTTRVRAHPSRAVRPAELPLVHLCCASCGGDT